MSLTTNIRNRIIDGLNMAFDAVGFTDTSKMPRAKKSDNVSPIAWEYFVSSYIRTRANARYDRAKKAAVTAGVIPDVDKEPMEPGFTGPVFNGEHVSIWLTVKQAATRVDARKLCDFLHSKGVSQQLLDEATNAASVKNKPAHEFKASLVAAEISSK